MAIVCASATDAFAGDLLFRRHVLNAESEFIAAAAMDVNHDDLVDVVCGAYWYEAPNWTGHDVRDVEIINGRPDGYAQIPLDVNRDGWSDILSFNWRSRSLKWTEHPGAALGQWVVHTIDEPGPMETGRLYDVDGDGRLDALPNGARFAAWWSVDYPTGGSDASLPTWQRHPLPQELAGHGIGSGDVDGDGRADIVGQFGWAAAPEHPRTQSWQFHADFRLDRASVPILVVDVDEDGDNDLVWCRAHDFGVYWSERLSAGDSARRWAHHVIDSSWSGGHSPLWVDMDGDGRNELVVGKRYLAHEGRDPGEYDPQFGYRYQFDPDTRTWRRWLLSYNEGVGFGLDPKAVDLDGDGDLDLLCAGRNGLYWLENTGAPPTAEEAVARDPSAALAYSDHSNLMVVKDATGAERPVETPFDWGQRRSHILAALTQVTGRLPGPHARTALNVEREIGQRGEEYDRETLAFSISASQRAAAHLLVPHRIARQAPAVLIVPSAKLVGAGNTTDDAQRDSLALADALARHGFICLVPNYGWFAAASTETGAEASDYPSPMMRSIWSNIRAIDVLDVRDDVDSLRIGIVGQGTGGAASLMTAVLDQRVNAVVIDGGLTSFDKAFRSHDGAWAELLAAIAPRPLLLRASTGDAEAVVRLQGQIESANQVYRLRRAQRRFDADLPQPDETGTSDAAVEMVDWLVEALRP